MEDFASEENPNTSDRVENSASSPKIRKAPAGLLRVRQAEELMMRPETVPEKFHPVNPDDTVVTPGNVVVVSRPTVTAEQLSKALENLKTDLRNKRQGGAETQPKPTGSGIESPPVVDCSEPNRDQEFRPTVNVGTR